jgi:aryl-alcohol dehydrogenase-like predicted oxidoreductase
VVVGARTEEQLADNLKAADLTLSADERARLDEASAPPTPDYPYRLLAEGTAERRKLLQRD